MNSKKTQIRKIYISVSIALSVFIAGLLSCNICTGYAGTAEGSVNAKRLSIVAEIYPLYDWIQNVLGDNPAGMELSLLIGNGTDMHSYQPSVSDMVKISSCDILIYIGGESDEWVGDAASQAVNNDITVVSMMDEMDGAMLCEEGLPGPAEETSDPVADDEEEYDEHIWLSLNNAQILCQRIADVLAEKDPANADVYQSNAALYTQRLSDLDTEYKKTVKEGRVSTVLFADRFPFRYMANDYGLDYYAAFEGCSAETEASFETIIFLAQKTDELSLGTVLTIDGSDGRLASAVVNSTSSKDQKILTIDSMQSVNQQDIAAGISYLNIMEQNLDILKQALE